MPYVSDSIRQVFACRTAFVRNLALTIFLVLLLAPLAYPGTAQRVLSAPSLSVQQGNPVTVPITLSEGSGITAIQFTVSYDAALISVPPTCTPPNPVAGGTLLSGTDHSVTCNSATAGQISIVVVSLSLQSLNSGSGSVVDITFDADAPGVSPLSLGGIVASDTAGSAVTVTGQDGDVTVTAGTTTTLPSEAIPTLNDWGIIAMSVLLALFGLGALRRRKEA
ncbi:MAG: cohesin domain-containing protein [Acidobacteriota bacterium]